MLDQSLVVRRILGVPEHLVRPRPRVVDLVVPAQRDRHAGHDARRRLPGRRGGAGDARHDVFADRALVGHPENRSVGELARDPEHHRRSAASRIGVGDDVGDVERVVNVELVVLDVDRARARERRVQHLDVVPHLVGGPLVGKAQHVADDPVVRRADTEREPALAHRLVRQRLLRHRDRMTGLYRHHRGPELDPRRRGPHQRDRGERVEFVRDLRHPDRREAGPLGRFRVADEPARPSPR